MESVLEKEQTSKSSPTAARSTSPRGSIAKRTHPKVSTMVKNAMRDMKSRGDCLSEVKQYIALVYKVDTEELGPAIAEYVQQAIASGYSTTPIKNKPAVAKVMKPKHSDKAGSNQTTMDNENQNTTCNMNENTELAQAYFKKNNYMFKNQNMDANKSGKDGYGNTIFYDSYIVKGKEWTYPPSELDDKLKKLAETIEKNSDLFCQIECLVRKIPVNEVRNYDIKLIVQNLSCSDGQKSGEYYDKNVNYTLINMKENTPLAILGYMAQSLSSQVLKERSNVTIMATKNTAAVCQLFAELCHSVGLDSVSTNFVDEETADLRMDYLSAINTGCIGVVTERCDVDSAIDTFLQTTTKYPWKLSRVLVEESVFSSFSKAIATKAGQKPEQLPPGLQSAGDCSTAAFAYNGKTFLIDFKGDSKSASGAILVEAYKKRKELLAFLEKNHTLYLSLWASDIAQANQIAHAVSSSIVWINCYGEFDGPPQASKAFYTEIDMDASCIVTKSIHVTRIMAQKQGAWAKMSFEQRRVIVQNATDEYCNDSTLNESNLEFLKNLGIALRNLKNDNFVVVQNNRMCVGLSMPIKFVGLPTVHHDEFHVEELAKFLTNGCAISYRKSNTFLCKYFKHLNTRASEVPIGMYYDDTCCGHERFISTTTAYERTKVIWTNFGK